MGSTFMERRERKSSDPRTRLERFADRFVEITSPKKALQRKAERVALQRANQLFSYYDASKRTRGSYDWNPGAGSADLAILPEYASVRKRARDRERNDPHARAIVETMTDNVIGTGLKPQANVDADYLKLDPKEAEDWNRACEREWARAVPYLDQTGRLDAYGIQRMAFQRTYVDGDFFVQRTRLSGAMRPTQVAFELIEGDRIYKPGSSAVSKSGGTIDTNRIREGIELGSRMEPVACWVALDHPYDYARSSRVKRTNRYARVRMKDSLGMPIMMHLYRPDRPEQTRGISSLAATLKYFEKLEQYLEAEIVGKQLEACIGLIRTMDPTALMAELSGLPTETLEGRDYSLSVTEWEPGMDVRLLPGEKVELLDPKRPGNTFDPFLKRYLTSLGAAVSVPYVLYSKDYSAVNYSSYRGALLDFLRHCATWHEWITCNLCRPMWDAVMFEAWTEGRLPQVPLLDDPQSWLRSRWLPIRRDWVDPRAEAQAEILGLDNKTKTMAEVLGSRGIDWQEHLEQRARERAFERDVDRKFGLSADLGESGDGSGPAVGSGSDGDDDEGERDVDDDDTDSEE